MIMACCQRGDPHSDPFYIQNNFDWSLALANLRDGAMELTEFESAVANGRLANPEAVTNDNEFQQAHAAHPQGVVNRLRRIGAADHIPEELIANPRAATATRLAILHDALFDTSAAVREQMVIILALLRSRESLPVLRRLLQLEDPGTMQIEYITEAIEYIEGQRAPTACPHLKYWFGVAGMER
jgi:hypothetical protein